MWLITVYDNVVYIIYLVINKESQNNASCIMYSIISNFMSVTWKKFYNGNWPQVSQREPVLFTFCTCLNRRNFEIFFLEYDETSDQIGRSWAEVERSGQSLSIFTLTKLVYLIQIFKTKTYRKPLQNIQPIQVKWATNSCLSGEFRFGCSNTYSTKYKVFNSFEIQSQQHITKT